MNNSETFNQNGYVIVRNALSKELVDFLTQYAFLDEQNNFESDTQVPGSHARYSDQAMESLLLMLQKMAEENTGLNLYPTYSYYRLYRPGAELKKHKDRPSCEISMTVSLGNHYVEENYDWPIYLNGQECVLNPGDVLFYKGMEVDHWRNIFDASEGSWHVQSFLHYVDADGPNSNWKYDKRPSIGYTSEALKGRKLK
jgi:hypothetical protein